MGLSCLLTEGVQKGLPLVPTEDQVDGLNLLLQFLIQNTTMGQQGRLFQEYNLFVAGHPLVQRYLPLDQRLGLMVPESDPQLTLTANEEDKESEADRKNLQFHLVREFLTELTGRLPLVEQQNVVARFQEFREKNRPLEITREDQRGSPPVSQSTAALPQELDYRANSASGEVSFTLSPYGTHARGYIPSRILPFWYPALYGYWLSAMSRSGQFVGLAGQAVLQAFQVSGAAGNEGRALGRILPVQGAFTPVPVAAQEKTGAVESIDIPASGALPVTRIRFVVRGSLSDAEIAPSVNSNLVILKQIRQVTPSEGNLISRALRGAGNLARRAFNYFRTSPRTYIALSNRNNDGSTFDQRAIQLCRYRGALGSAGATAMQLQAPIQVGSDEMIADPVHADRGPTVFTSVTCILENPREEESSSSSFSNDGFHGSPYSSSTERSSQPVEVLDSQGDGAGEVPPHDLHPNVSHVTSEDPPSRRSRTLEEIIQESWFSIY